MLAPLPAVRKGLQTSWLEREQTSIVTGSLEIPGCLRKGSAHSQTSPGQRLPLHLQEESFIQSLALGLLQGHPIQGAQSRVDFRQRWLALL